MLRLYDASEQKYIRLRISDTGDGIAPENLDRIFDPYFTTKGVETGTGLGLSVVHGIIKDCSGAVFASSELGEGTTITVLLPVTQEDMTAEEVSESASLPVGDERILFVDDERHLAIIGKEMLETLGYAARDVNSADDALKIFTEDIDRYDLVITDMAMPGMTGPDLARKIFKMRPDMPMILCTGHHDKMDADRARAMGFKAFLMKPVTVSMLANLVRKVLDET